MKSFRVQELFEDIEQLTRYCDNSQHIKWGYDTIADLWNANPTVQFK